MIPYELDPTLHTAPPAPTELGDGFTQAPATGEPPDAAPRELAGAGLDQPPSQF